MKADLFQSCDPCWVFQICWHAECSTFTASSFTIWNNSTGILSPPLGMFVVMLPKAHVTLHSRTSGSRWVITPSWLSELLRSFLYSSSLYSCHFILISSASGKHCKNKIQKCTNFFCNSFFLIGSNNLKNNYKVLLLVSFQNKFEKTPLSEKNPLKWSTMCF